MFGLSGAPSWRGQVPNAMFLFEEQINLCVKTSLVGNVCTSGAGILDGTWYVSVDRN